MEQTEKNVGVNKDKGNKRGIEQNYKISEKLNALLAEHPDMDGEARTNIILARDISWKKFKTEKERSQIKQ